MFRHLRPYQIVVDAGIAGLFALIAVPLELGTVDYLRVDVLQVLAMVLPFTAALAIRRLSPGLSLAVAWLGAVVQMLLLIGPRPTDVAIFAVLYVTAAYGSRLVFWLGFASAVGGSLVITVYLFGVVNGIDLINLSGALAVLVAALFALGLSGGRSRRAASATPRSPRGSSFPRPPSRPTSVASLPRCRFATACGWSSSPSSTASPDGALRLAALAQGPPSSRCSG